MSMLGYDEKRPYPMGHRLARPYFSWIAYVLIVVGVPIMIVTFLYALEWCTSYPLVIPLLLLIYWCLCAAGFGLNALWWGAGYRDRLTGSNTSRDGTDAVSS